jgi:hypothetical protein
MERFQIALELTLLHFFNSRSKFWSGLIFFKKIEDNGATSLTHHLPKDKAKQRFFASAYAAGCRLVEAESTSRTTANMDKHCCSQRPPLPLFKAATAAIDHL